MVELQCQIEYPNGSWETVDYEVFRSWGGRRKLNGQLYYGIVYQFLTDIEDVTGHQAYEEYLRGNISESNF